MEWRKLLDDRRVQVLVAGAITAWLLGAAFETLIVLWVFGLDSLNPILWLTIFLSRVFKPFLWAVAALGSVFPPLTNLTMETPADWQVVSYVISTTLVAGSLGWLFRPRSTGGDAGW